MDAVFTTMKRLMATPEIQAEIIRADSRGDTPFDTVYKYETIVKRCPSTASMLWCVCGLIDWVRAGLASTGELSVRQLSGKGLPGGKGVLDVLIGKQEVAHALTRTSESIGLSPDLARHLSQWSLSHTNYRADMGYTPGEKDTQWVSAMSPPDIKFLDLFQDICSGIV